MMTMMWGNRTKRTVSSCYLLDLPPARIRYELRGLSCEVSFVVVCKECYGTIWSRFAPGLRVSAKSRGEFRAMLRGARYSRGRRGC